MTDDPDEASAPEIHIDVPGSFPWNVFHERHPELVRKLLDALPYGPAERAAVRDLLAESTGGVLSPPDGQDPDHGPWTAWGEGLWGRPWREAPFLWAENWFHHRLLDATGYLRPGTWHGVDPFGPLKHAELAGAAVDEQLLVLDGLAGLPAEHRTPALLSSALWGNRADLGFRLIADPDDAHPATGVIVDDTAELLAWLPGASGGRISVIADNAGRELLPDLVLIDHLLATGIAAEAVLYLKPRPYFVSDATTADLLAALDRLRTSTAPAAAAVGRRLDEALRRGTLLARTHPFFCAPLTYHDLPGDLRAELAGSALTVLKGDLNYRRLVGDRHWPPAHPFARATGHFPTPVVALRTLKSDVALGIAPATAADLDATTPHWRTDGRHAVVQARLG
ncbi:damage-control phosphatase ARMT1 family protein [Kitasatospora sp. NPDC004240]